MDEVDALITSSIAIIRLPAAIPESDPRHGGTIITNPGGPGGSGVADMLIHGRHLKDIVDGEKEYDILSFDPRGIYHSEPIAECFKIDFARQMFSYQLRDIGHLDQGSSVLRRRRAHAAAFGQICEEANDLVHMSTAVVARDMLEIVHQIAARRQKSVSQSSGHGRHTALVEDAKLQYFGFSYGTQLGQTFASMFPNRVKSMILDGVADANDFSQGVSIPLL